jgi:prefoldin subunit 5
MSNIRVRGSIRPKISTMPRNNSQASKQLELYKLVTEEQRIQQELIFIEQRVQQLKQRLSVLDSQRNSIEKAIQDLRNVEPNSPKNTASSEPVVEVSKFQTYYLEY